MKDKQYAVVYSLNHKKLIASGVNNYMEVLDAYSNKETDHLGLSEELIKSEILEPVILIDISETGGITHEQLEHIGSLSGKEAVRNRRDDMEYLMPLLDKPFWKAEQGMLISTNDNTEIFLNSGNKVFNTSDIILKENQSNLRNDYVHSFNLNSLSEAFSEARDVIKRADENEIDDVLENSDRESRMIFIGAIVNNSLGMSVSDRESNEKIVELFNNISDLDEYVDYKNNVGLAGTQNPDIKAMHQIIKKVEDLAITSSDLSESNPDYIKNVINPELDKILMECRKGMENKLIQVLDGKSPEPDSPKPKASKKKEKSSQMTLGM